MFWNLIVILCLIATVISGNSDCSDVECAIPPKHYRELGCNPVIENNECCPSRFECPDKATFASDKCYWKGEAFDIGAQLPYEETGSLCSAACYCAEGYPKGQRAEFRCAQIECGHFFSSELNKCIHQSTLDSCCPKYLCTEEEKSTLGTATCELDGRSYRIGEIIYPKSVACYKCVCAENFDNSTIILNPACEEINCGFELRYLNDFLNGCIPTYYGTSACCSIGWRCPRDTDEMLPSESRSIQPSNPSNQCQFGKLTLEVGDTIKSADKCEVCQCVMPPMAHCIKKSKCYK